MTEIPWPAAVPVCGFSLTMLTDQRVSSAQFGGSEHVVDLDSDIWLSTVEFEFSTRIQSGALDVFLTRLSTGVTYVKFGHLARPKNRGTLSGAVTTILPTPKGSDYMTISAQAGETLLAGDMLECEDLLLQVGSDAIAEGNSMEVFLVNRVRKSLLAFSPVNVTTPKAKFRLISPASLTFNQNFSERCKVDFEEFV
jgi:hypothetical protein